MDSACILLRLRLEGGGVGSAITTPDKKAGRPVSPAQCTLAKTMVPPPFLYYASAIKLLRMSFSGARQCEAVLASAYPLSYSFCLHPGM